MRWIPSVGLVVIVTGFGCPPHRSALAGQAAEGPCEAGTKPGPPPGPQRSVSLSGFGVAARE